MKIVLFYQYYHNPDCGATSRHYSLLKRLSREHEITVVTTDMWKKRRLSSDYPWLPEGVKEISFTIPYANEMGVARRFLAFAHYALRSVSCCSRVWDADLIWGSSTPLTAAWAADRCARRLGVPWVFEVRDLWPDFPIQMGAIRNKLAIKWLKRIERQLYRNAGHIVALSPDMDRHIRQFGISPECISVLMNGTDLDILDSIKRSERDYLRTRHGIGDKRIVMYAGTFGRANDIPSLIATAERLRERKDILFVFLGHGFHSETLDALSKRQKNVRILPMRPRRETLAWFQIADLSLVSFIDLPVLSANSPAKLFDSLGAGTPVIVTNPGWMDQFVHNHGVGWYVPPEQPAKLADKILELIDQPNKLADAGQRGEKIARAQFNRADQAEQLNDIFVALVDRKRNRRKSGLR